MAIDLAQTAKQNSIKYFLISFVDLFGVLRAKLVPASAIGAMQEEGAGFAGFRDMAGHDPGRPGHACYPRPEQFDRTALE